MKTKDEIMALADSVANANYKCTVAANTIGTDSSLYTACCKELNETRAALSAALDEVYAAQPQVQERPPELYLDQPSATSYWKEPT